MGYVVVNTFTGCWTWSGGKTDGGYGGFWLNGGTVLAHRFAYAMLRGPIPEGLDLDHGCRNRACVNPDHLEPVTCAVNIQRGISHNGSKTHCSQGHPYSPENTAIKSDGRRVCRECNRIWCREKHRRRKEKAAEAIANTPRPDEVAADVRFALPPAAVAEVARVLEDMEERIETVGLQNGMPAISPPTPRQAAIPALPAPAKAEPEWEVVGFDPEAAHSLQIIEFYNRPGDVVQIAPETLANR